MEVNILCVSLLSDSKSSPDQHYTADTAVKCLRKLAGYFVFWFAL